MQPIDGGLHQFNQMVIGIDPNSSVG